MGQWSANGVVPKLSGGRKNMSGYCQPSHSITKLFRCKGEFFKKYRFFHFSSGMGVGNVRTNRSTVHRYRGGAESDSTKTVQRP